MLFLTAPESVAFLIDAVVSLPSHLGGGAHKPSHLMGTYPFKGFTLIVRHLPLEENLLGLRTRLSLGKVLAEQIRGPEFNSAHGKSQHCAVAHTHNSKIGKAQVRVSLGLMARRASLVSRLNKRFCLKEKGGE